MSKIHNKISSIESDDDIINKALGLYPLEEKPKQATDVDDTIETDNTIIPSSNLRKDIQSTDNPIAKPKKWPSVITLILFLLWVMGSTLTAHYMFDLNGIFEFSPIQLGGLSFFILFPLLLLLALYSVMRQLSILSVKSQSLERATQNLMRVDDTVARRAAEMSSVVKSEISNLNDSIDQALSRAATLQGTMDEQAEKLGQTTLSIEENTQLVTQRLTTERQALLSMSTTVENQMQALTDALDNHSENLTQSTKVAEQKIQEARVSVETTADKINQTSDIVRQNTLQATQALSDNQREVLQLSEQLKTRASELENIYQKHSHELNAMIVKLQNEQGLLDSSLEDRLNKMRDVALSAQVSAERLTDASEAGQKTITALSEATRISENTIQQRFTDVEEMVKFSNARAESITENAARRVQDSLSQTRKEISRIEEEMLNLENKLAQTSNVSTQPTSTTTKTSFQTQDITPPTPTKKKRRFLNIRPLEEKSTKTSQIEIPVSPLRPAPQQQAEIIHKNKNVEKNIKTNKAPTTSSDQPSGTTTESPKSNTNPVNIDIDNGVMRPKEVNENTNINSITPHPTTLGENRIAHSNGNEKTSWWKSLFGYQDNQSQAIDIITARHDMTDNTQHPQIDLQTSSTRSEGDKQALTHTMFLDILSNNGLSPNVIVDDGAIIQAVETRIAKGTKQMSLSVAKRLGEPIRHLTGLLNDNHELKEHAISFAANFHHSLTPIHKDAMAMQSQLQSNDGRLFLMCDAALNT